MNILHVTPYYPPAKIGGVGEFSRLLHEELRQRGHTSEVVTAGVVHEHQPGVLRSGSTVGWALRLPFAIWRRRNVDVVHFHIAGESLPGVVMAALLGIPTVGTFHVRARRIALSMRPYRVAGRLHGASGGKQQLMQRTIDWGKEVGDRLAARWCTRLTAVSRYGVSECEDISQRPIDCVYYGLRETAAGGGDRSGAGGRRGDTLLYVGVANARKRLMLLPEVLHEVRRGLPEARLVVAGFRREQAPDFSARLRELDLESAVDFLGCLPSEHLGPVYSSAGCLLVPSAYEGLPFVILEAFRAGTPPIVTDVVGHGEAVENGKNGFLVPLGDASAMAGKAIQLLRDPALAERLGRGARETFEERFTVERMVSGYEAVYERACGAASPPGG